MKVMKNKSDKTSKYYNWWEDPNNKEEVDKLSWWNHEKNMTSINFPVSVVQESDVYVASFNKDTDVLMGHIPAVAQGKTKEEAISKMFRIVDMHVSYLQETRLNYQRFVPFRIGPWSKGGKWFSIFGIHISFRYMKNVKGGFYIPFTKLNISISNDWTVYKRYMEEQKRKRNISNND